MSTKFIFTIFDCVSEKAGNIFTADTIAEAERQFNDALKHATDGSLFKSHPEDFSLRLLGEFDDKKSKLLIQNPLKLLTVRLLQPSIWRNLR